MTSIKIYSAHHQRPSFEACHDMFVPFWGGGDPPEHAEYIVDALAPRKPTRGYNEMSQQYYAWKHLLTPGGYVGFEHYRRIFVFSELFGDMSEAGGGIDRALRLAPGDWHTYADEAVFAALLRRRSDAGRQRVAALRDFITSHDVILPCPYREGSLRQQWLDCRLEGSVLDLLATCIMSAAAYKKSPFPVDFNINKIYFCNFFVMRADLFDQYMLLWEQVMFALQGSIDFSTRMPAYLSERLFAVWIYHRLISSRLKFAEVPFCLCNSRKVPSES